MKLDINFPNTLHVAPIEITISIVTDAVRLRKAVTEMQTNTDALEKVVAASQPPDQNP